LQVHKFLNEARKNLFSRKLIGENFQADVLPGGPWKESSTREVCETVLYDLSAETYANIFANKNCRIGELGIVTANY
jgi:hypothetical protein